MPTAEEPEEEQLCGFHLSHSAEQDEHDVIANLVLANALNGGESFSDFLVRHDSLPPWDYMPTPILRKPPDGIARDDRLPCAVSYSSIAKLNSVLSADIAILAWHLPSVPNRVGRVNS